MAQTPEKDTIYVDVDDEITGIIEKVRGSDEKIVALVLPKRATVLQSIVNMKLLKRSAGEFHKKVVLITSEANLLPLAGAVGLYVAKTLQSAPAIPDPPSTATGMLDAEVSDDDGDDVPVDKSEPIGKLAGMPDEEETIDVDDADDDAAKAGVAGAVGAAAKKVKNKKLKVPNFDSFRRKLFLVVGGLVALFFFWILLNKVLPKATITITTDSSTVDTKLDFTADSGAEKVDEAKHVLPATQKTFTKTDKEKVATSGQKDNGKKASGKVTLKLTDCSQSQVTVPSGTTVAANGLNFITQGDANMSSVVIAGQCKNDDYPTFSTSTVKVEAQNAGDKYNVGATNYSVSGFSNVSGSGTAMSGGTSSIVKIVSQSDINGAKQKILDRNTGDAKDELDKQMKADQLYAITDTFTDGTPAVTSSSKAGDEAEDVTVTLTVSYTMLGVKNDELKNLVENEAKKQIDPAKQTILSTGLDAAKVSVTHKTSDTKVNASLQTTAEAGPQLDPMAIKKEIAGKKRGDTQAIIENRPGIKDVKIVYSPFWVGATPSRLSRITVTFVQPNGSPSSQP